MIPGKAHQNADAEKRKPWRDYYWAPYLEAPSISRRVFASIVYAWRLFSSPDEKRRGFFFLSRVYLRKQDRSNISCAYRDNL